MKISPDIPDGKIMLYINDGNGKVLSKYNRNGVLKYNYIFGNGSKLAKKNASGSELLPQRLFRLSTGCKCCVKRKCIPFVIDIPWENG